MTGEGTADITRAFSRSRPVGKAFLGRWRFCFSILFWADTCRFGHPGMSHLRPAPTQREKRCQVRISLAHHHCQGHAEIKTATRLLLLTVYRVHCRPDQHSYMPGTHPVPCIGYLGRPRPSKLVAEAATVFREWRYDNCEVLKAKGQSMGFHYCTRDSRMGLLCMWPGGVCHVTYTALVC
jgi:hypothetical protein